MIHHVLEMISQFVSSEMLVRFGTVTCGVTVLGKSDELTSNSILIFLLNIEKESHLRNTPPTREDANHIIPPPLGLKLTFGVLSTASGEATMLEHLSHVAAIFHENRVFEKSQLPVAIAAHNDELRIDMLSLNFEELNQIWSPYQRRMLPALYYSIRPVFLGPPPSLEGPAIVAIETTINDK